MKVSAELNIKFLARDLIPVIEAVAANERDTIGDSDLHDEQPVFVKITLGDYRRAKRLLPELTKTAG